MFLSQGWGIKGLIIFFLKRLSGAQLKKIISKKS